MNTSTTVRNVKRWWEVQSIFLRYGFDILVSKADVRQARRRSKALENGHAAELERMNTPQRLRLMLEELGPTYVKLGQVVSSQSGSIPQDWLRELERLQDKVPPFGADDVRVALVQELHEQPEYLFREFNFAPLAAASIGQVHTATLNDYEAVVVKVQRPGIQPQIESDLAIMREVARGLENTTTWARNYGALQVVDEFAVSIARELDYRNEAENMDRLRDVLAAVRGVRTPKVHWDLVTQRVLTMEHIKGVKISDLEGLEAAGVNREQLADTFVQAMVHQILIAGFFHADVHPGNVFVEAATGDLVFIDVGMTGSLDTRQRMEIVSLLRGLAQRDAHQLTQVVVSLGNAFKPVNEDVLENDLARLIRLHLSGSLSQFSYAKFLSGLLGTLFDNGLRVPSDLLFALKAIMQTEQIVRVLNPDSSITDIAQMASSLVLVNQLKPGALKESVVGVADQVLRIVPLLGDAIEQYVRDARRGSRVTRLDPNDIQHFSTLLSGAANRLMFVVMIVGAMVSSVLVMGIKGEGLLALAPIIGVIGFATSLAFALVVSARLLWNMWRQQ